MKLNGSSDNETMEQLARLLGIDFGTTRVGLALSDPLAIIASPYETVANDASLFKKIQALVQGERVTTIVVGMPFNLKGEKAKKALEVEAFAEQLKSSVSCEVIVWDERFTSSIAHQTLHTMGAKKKQREKKSTIDAMAAAIILQSFLDSTKHSRAC